MAGGRKMIQVERVRGEVRIGDNIKRVIRFRFARFIMLRKGKDFLMV